MRKMVSIADIMLSGVIGIKCRITPSVLDVYCHFYDHFKEEIKLLSGM